MMTGDSSQLSHGNDVQHTSSNLLTDPSRRQDPKLTGVVVDNGGPAYVVHRPPGIAISDNILTGNGDFIIPDSSSKIQTAVYLAKVPNIKVEHSLNEQEIEASYHSLNWLSKKPKSLVDLDCLEIETKVSDSAMEAHSEFPENDFVFSTSDNTLCKQGLGNCFGALENGDFRSSVSSSHIVWNSSQAITVQNGELGQLSGNTEAFVPFTDDTLDESVNNANTVSCNTNDLNSIFDNISHDITKSDPLSVEIMQYPNFSVDRNLICSEESVSSFNTITSADLKTVPLTFSGSIVDQVSLPNLHDNSSDLNLNTLPNFLGLESASATTNNSFIDSSSVNLLEGNSQMLSLENQTGTNVDSLQEQLLQGISSSDLKNQNVSVTTISISNDEKNSTKILIDSYQGQQQMYVINTSDLNKSHNVGPGNMLVINASELSPANNTFNISTLKPGVDRITMATQPLTTQAAITGSGIPGFVLVPVVDSTANVIQAVPIQITDGDSSSKKPKKILMCVAPGCRKTFKKASKLKVHQMLHTGERPFKCSLVGCDWAFTTSNKLKRHMESHEGRKDYVCNQPGCGHRFTTVYNLNTHRKLHDRPCTETCTEEGCNQKFATKRQLDLHLRNIHAFEDRTFKCPEPDCDKVFFSSGCMGSHMKIHQQNQMELKCKVPGCGKGFTIMCRLRQHERLHSGEKPYVCNYQGCNWAFAMASKLKRHQTKHTGFRKWICEVCKKQFHRSEHLKGHLITHSGDRPFICPVEGCSNTFTAKSSLYVHLKKHDESGKTIVYHCPMEKCDKHYANKASLRQHILVKHCNLQHQKGGEGNSQGVVSWLSLLSSGDACTDISLLQESYGEGLAQTALTPNQDNVLSTDFLTGGMADQSMLTPPGETLPDQKCSNLISQLMVSTGVNNSLASSDVAPVKAEADMPLHAQQNQQQQQMFSEDQIDPRLLEAGDILQQQERMSFEAVERGKKSQIMLENVHGSARTDPRSNDILSLRAIRRWQKQKEIEAAKLRAKLDAPIAVSVANNILLNTAVDYKYLVSNNVSLASQQAVQALVVPRPSNLSRSASAIKAEAIDMELQAEGLPISSMSSTSTDSFMTELFIRDPETGITYRQTQLLQDDPPNPEMMEDLEGVSSCHSMTLDSSLDTQFMEDSLSFHHL